MTADKEDPEVARVMEKANAGTINVINKILNQPEIQKILKENITKQTFTSGLFMSFFLLGFIMLFQAAKTVIGFGWQGDVIISITLICIGSAYMLKGLRGR